MTGLEMMMADVMTGIVLAVAFAMVAVVALAAYDPQPLEYL